MNVSLFQAAAAMTANARWQEVVAENLAASAQPGFKRQEVSFSAIAAGLSAKASGGAAYALPRAAVGTDFRPGELRPTGVTTDLGIEGRGFFTIQLSNGSEAYTRDGEFHINAQGALVTKQGHAVLGDNGPIQLDRNNAAPLTISQDGEVRQGAEVKGRLKVMDFKQTELLTPAGGGNYLATNIGLQPETVAEPGIRQGFLESSNTTSVMEMASMISAMRAFESSQKLVQAQDERMSKAIQELGNPN
ncbi:MAG: flagellar hook-basal body protein [Verrucomicrobiota bacterium]